MIDTKELRRLAQAALTGPDGVSLNWVKLLQDFQKEANPAAITELLDRLEHAESECLEQARLNGMGAEREAALMAKLEAAEKERGIDEQRIADLMEELNRVGHENDALRSKIAEMGRQEPVAWTTQLALELGSSALGFDACRGNLWGDKGVPLYALPGAQPAPSVPTSLLVAIADLVTQMEIVARVGFVDTPDDKDSCAAFCVAEGTWLELMSTVESLAASLAAAPEAKP